MKKKNGAKMLQSKKMYFVAAEMQKKKYSFYRNICCLRSQSII